MFGFLRLQSCALTPEERRLYASHFCSACHAMTRFGGRVSSLLTNYDITFWLLLSSALEQTPDRPSEQRPCTALPFKNVAVKPMSGPVGETMAALNLLLTSSKLEDDAQDGHAWKSWAARSVYQKKFRKAEEYLGRQGFPVEAITGLAKSQFAVEKKVGATLDALAEPTSRSLGEVFAVIARLHRQPELEDPLREFGRNLGGFLYLWDALVDFDEDRRNLTFNAFSWACQGNLKSVEIRPAFFRRLENLRDGLDRLALGPEGKLCYGLLASLDGRLKGKLPQPSAAGTLGSRRERLSRAGFVRTQDCCEVDCCECGSCCDCNICDCNPCNDTDHCCSLSCCDCGLCCCDMSGPSRGTSFCALDNCDTICLTDACFGRSSDPSGATTSNGFLARVERARTARNLPATAGEASSRSCPKCALNMIALQVGSTQIEECRNCGGVWLDHKELDELAKLTRLPHNLLSRYPMEEAPIQHLAGERPCPKCAVKLVGVPYLGVPVEMCGTCHGFWVEHGSLGPVLKAKRSPKRLLKAHKQDWRCPYCQKVAVGGEDACAHCGAPRPKSGFTGKLG